MKHYDYLIVGAGLFGLVFAREATDAGKRCLIIDRRNHIGGNVYTRREAGIDVHVYGAHIFHTNNEAVWKYMNRFADFNRFTNSPIANYKGELYNLPFNMNTFHALWGVRTPEEARAKIEEQRLKADVSEPSNLEQQALRLVGTDIYEKLIKGYTEKQWGRSCKELPSFIIRRLPLRFTYDNNYFSDPFQGIPQNGYTALAEKMTLDIDCQLETDYLRDKPHWDSLADRTIYTGAIDEFFGYRYGALAYRSLRFETQLLEESNHQGVAVMNYTDRETPYTRVIEHKHFAFGEQPRTLVTREYPREWKPGEEAFYPVNDEQNQALYQRYVELAKQETNVIFGGRLGQYRYLDMDQVVLSALGAVEKAVKNP